MLVDGREVLEWATRRSCAAASFNTYNLELTRAVVDAAEAERTPIFLAAGTGALEYASFELLTAVALEAADAARVPVAVHLDHAPDVAWAQRAVQAGFTSVMVDGSALTYAANVALLRGARAVVAGALEAELGGIGGSEDRSVAQRTAIPMTDPGEAERFVADTGIDSLAVAIGNAHGLYKGEPRLDLHRLAALRDAVPVPLVLHGASGIPDGLIRSSIELGVRKINVNTELRRTLFDSLRAGLAKDDTLDLPVVFGTATAAVTEAARAFVRLFRGDAMP